MKLTNVPRVVCLLMPLDVSVGTFLDAAEIVRQIRRCRGNRSEGGMEDTIYCVYSGSPFVSGLKLDRE